MILDNKTAVITGGSRGLGIHVASAFIKSGITNLIIIARKQDELEKSLIHFNAIKISKYQNILIHPCDISSHLELEILLNFFKDRFNKLDILVNNASSFGPIGFFEDVNFDDWLETVNVNYIGTARVIKHFLPFLKKSIRAKIINIVGGGASKPYGCLSGYATSKVAVVRFTEELASELAKYNIDVNCLAPGPLNTRFVKKMLSVGEQVLGKELYKAICDIDKFGGTPMEIPSELCCYLASNNSNGITGKMLSARYDDWKNFPKNKSKMSSSDIYTLRRKNT